MAVAVEVEGLVRRFGRRRAVDGLTFAVAEGEILGLLGPNGAGKTTTIAILATLDVPDEGRAAILGHDVVRDRDAVRPLLGFVPQDLALYPGLSARDNLAFFGRVYGLTGRTLDERVRASLELAGLVDRAGDRVASFSGGMMRRLNLAAALVHGPRVLLLDEPTVGVDPQSRNHLLDHVRELRDGGMAIVYTSHQMDEVQRLCDRVAIVDGGKLLALDSPRALIERLGEGLVIADLPDGGGEGVDSCIARLGEVGRPVVRDGKLHLEATNLRGALAEILRMCDARGVPLQSLEVLEPNLESVFLRLTGRRLRD